MTEALFALANPMRTPFRFKPAPVDALKKLSDVFRAREYSEMLVSRGTPSERRQAPVAQPTTISNSDADQLVNRLFYARAQAKQIASSLSMHLPTEWRTKIYRQIDELHELDEWDKDSRLLDPRTMLTFLRFVIFADVKGVPSLGLSSSGNVVAAWRRDTRRLTIEFLPNDMCRLAISHFAGADPSIFTFSGQVTTARSYLQREAFSLG